jgi:hypothetical protein
MMRSVADKTGITEIMPAGRPPERPIAWFGGLTSAARGGGGQRP